MAFTHIANSRIDADSPGSQQLFTDLRDNDEYVYGVAGSSANAGNAPLVINGSFDMDATGTTSPTGWTVTNLLGGSGSVTNTDSTHGGLCYMAVHPGVASNGGQVLTMSSPLSCSMDSCYDLFFSLRASAAGVRIKAEVAWYDHAGSQIGSNVSIVDLNGSIPTSWRGYRYSLFPLMTPSLACFMNLVFTLGDTSVNPGSSTNIYIDNITLKNRDPFQSIQTYISGTSNFTVPAGIYKILSKNTGGGGGGGKGALVNGGGGGGGEYAERILSVYPGQVLVCTPGVGGIAGTGSGSNGTNGTASTTDSFSAAGGSGGNGSTYAGGSGGSTSWADYNEFRLLGGTGENSSEGGRGGSAGNGASSRSKIGTLPIGHGGWGGSVSVGNGQRGQITLIY